MLHTVLNQSLVWLNFGIGRGDKQQDYPAKNICLKSLLSKNDDKNHHGFAMTSTRLRCW